MANEGTPLNKLKPLNRLKPFTRINNDAFRPPSTPSGDGMAAGCHVPDEFPNLEADFKEFIKNNTGAFGELTKLLEKARQLAKQVADALNTASLVAKLAALAIALGLPLGGIGAAIAALAAIATAVATINNFISQVLDIVDTAIREFFTKIGAKLAIRAVRRIPQWVPVEDSKSNQTVTKAQIREVEGIVTRSYGDPIEAPFFQWHEWFNWSFQLKPEDKYKNLLVPGFELNSDGAKGDPSIIQKDTLEVQWDTGALLVGKDGASGPYETGFKAENIPQAVDGPMNNADTGWIWPVTGMYAWASGRWVYDCTRTDKISGTDPKPKMMTMINPPRAVATATWEAVDFPENLSSDPNAPVGSNTVPAIRFMFVASRHGGYINYDSIADEDYEFILDLPPIDAPVTPFPIGHMLAHKRDPGELPDFPHNTIVLRPRLLRQVTPIQSGVTFIKQVTPEIELLPPPDGAPNGTPKQVKVTIRKDDLQGASGGYAGCVLSLGWLDPNLVRAQTVKKVTLTFNSIKGRLTPGNERDSPLKQLREPFEAEIKKLKEELHKQADDIKLPLPPPLPKPSINDLINNKLPAPLNKVVADIGREFQKAVHAMIDKIFDTILDGITDLIAGAATEEWMVRIGVNGRWRSVFLPNVSDKAIGLPSDFQYKLGLGPDDLLFFSSSGVEFSPVGDMMCAPRTDRLLTHKDRNPLTWQDIVSASGQFHKDLIFNYALAEFKGNSAVSGLALGFENSPLGIMDPGAFGSPGTTPGASNPLAVGKVQPGASPLALPDVKFARAAGEELILVETRDADYRFTGTIDIVQQQPK